MMMTMMSMKFIKIFERILNFFGEFVSYGSDTEYVVTKKRLRTR